MSHLRISFASGVVRPMLATRTRPGVMGKFDAEAVARCKGMDQSATVLDKETLSVIGSVTWTPKGFVYTPRSSSDVPTAS